MNAPVLLVFEVSQDESEKSNPSADPTRHHSSRFRYPDVKHPYPHFKLYKFVDYIYLITLYQTKEFPVVGKMKKVEKIRNRFSTTKAIHERIQGASARYVYRMIMIN